MKHGASLSVRFAGILLLTVSCCACDVFFSRRVFGVVRSPAGKCGAADEELVSGAVVELTCPAGSGATIGGAGPTATTDEKGAFLLEITAFHAAAMSACRLRVRRDGYKPLEGSIAEFEPRPDAQMVQATVVKVRLERSPAAP
jgi:hypothetical protein